MTSPFVITVGRQLGSGGRQIGKRLAERFGIAYYDKEILSLAAQESGLGTGVFERSDERKGFLHSIAQVVQPFFGGGGSFYDNQLSDENLFTIQSRVIQKVAAERSCVVPSDVWPTTSCATTRTTSTCSSPPRCRSACRK